MGVYILPYAPARGGAWDVLVKQFKIVLILDITFGTYAVELLTCVESAVKIVNERPLVPPSDDHKNFTAITPALLLNP